MNIYCPHCGRSIPSDSKLCAYCGKYIPPGSTQTISAYPQAKPKERNTLLIVVLVLVILIVASIAILATVYVYVSGTLPNGPSSHTEDASVAVYDNNGLISISLTSAGSRYENGYNNGAFYILINYQSVQGLESIGTWIIGETINIGKNGYDYSVNGDALTPGEYEVRVILFGSIIYSNYVDIT